MVTLGACCTYVMLIASLLPPAPVTISHQGLPQEPVHTVIRHLPKVSAPDHVAAPNHPTLSQYDSFLEK